MVKYSVGGEVRVAHVATPECKEAWAAIKTNNNVQVMAEFTPSDHVDIKQITKIAGNMGSAGGEILGIITADNRCYAIGAVKQQVSGNTNLVVTSVNSVN